MAKRGVPAFKDPAKVQELIDKYFDECAGTVLKDHNGDPMVDKWGNPVILNRRPPTVTGLALALGFTNRQSLLNYQGKPEFRDIITRAKSVVEMYTEERLFDKDGSNGARFSLQFNFRGWRDDKPEEKQGPTVRIVCDIPKEATPPEEASESANVLDPLNVSEAIKALDNKQTAGGGNG